MVYLADKMVQGDRTVTLERRFEDNRRRCAEAEDREEALTTHERRYIQAKKDREPDTNRDRWRTMR